MGVPGFFSWLIKNHKKLGANDMILNISPNNIKWLMLDTNCLLHPCVANILEKYKKDELKIDKNKDLRIQIEKYIWNKITESIDNMINRMNPEYLYIPIDGVAPMGKILQQRQRRYRYFFDKKIKLNETEEIETKISKTLLKSNGIEEPILPISSIELTPGTDYMERLNKLMEEYIKTLKKRGIKCIYSSYHEEGEGEHKLLQYIKKNLKSQTEPIVIYGLDADLLFLSLSVDNKHDLYVMREKQIFNNKEVNLDDEPEYNYVNLKHLRTLVSNLEISINDFIVLCYLIGNDFLPGLLTTDIKNGGLDKIFKAWNNLKLKKHINDNQQKSYLSEYDEKTKRYKINLPILKCLFEELTWTEQYIWKNMNRDKLLNQHNLKQEEKKELLKFKEEYKKNQLKKFISGETANTDFLEKIEFSSSQEYYGYYLGVESIRIDELIIKKIVLNYIEGIEWCLCYYLDECPNWSWGYNFMIPPLIKDILNFFPQTNEHIKIEYQPRTLNPVEQLILAVPPQTYEYLIEKNIIEQLKSNHVIGYMFPETYHIDINKEHLFWKCQVKIPIVEYFEFKNEIKKLNISNDKNKIYGSIKNF